MVEKGATTIWELWNGDTADPAMNSGNHVMQIGDLAVWMYEYLAGIRSDPEQPGFKHVLHPPVSGRRSDLRASVAPLDVRDDREPWKRDAAVHAGRDGSAEHHRDGVGARERRRRRDRVRQARERREGRGVVRAEGDAARVRVGSAHTAFGAL